MTKNCTARSAALLGAALAVSTPLLAGCMDRPPGSDSSAHSLDERLAAFPTGKLTIESGSGNGDRRHDFDIWVADSAERRARGLMFVEHLPKDRGMLFLFGDPQPVSMWMKNTLIPLDMLFVTVDGRIARIAQNTVPQSLDTIESGADVTAVLELGGGECARLGLREGDYLRHAAFTARK